MENHHGLGLVPRPSGQDDPLRWPRYLKFGALFATAMTNFTANFAGSGLSVATNVLMAQFHKSENEVNGLLTLNFLFLGVGNLFWVPIAVKFGKRASLLIAAVMLFAVLVWTATADDFESLLAARCLSGFASAAGESVVPGIVADIFFLHERAAMMSSYTILIAGATAIGPLVASFIIQYSPGTWVTYMWVCAGLAGFNVLLLFFLYPESNYARPDLGETSSDEPEGPVKDDNALEPSASLVEKGPTGPVAEEHVIAVKKPWRDIWLSLVTVGAPEVTFLRVFYRPLIHLMYPDVLFAIFLYGSALASQIILIFAFPTLLLAPPYLFDPIGVGLMQIASIVGIVFATFAGGYLADIVTARVILRQGRVFPEQRLIALLPFGWVNPAGCILTAFACSEKLHWIAIAFGFGMLSFGTVYGPNVAITFVVESHPSHADEALVAINVFKNLVAFLFLYTAVGWVQSQGWLQVYMIMFMLVSLGMLLTIPFYFCRTSLRSSIRKVDRLL